MRGPTVFALMLLAAFSPAREAAAAPGCAGDGPWVQLQLGVEGWTEAQRASVLSDLQHTLASQGIAACSADAHPPAAALATLTVDLSPEDTAKATVDIEVRDAVTRKRVRRDVDLSRIPDDGRAAAIAIEADELLRASWAEVALDTARAREAQAQARPQVVSTVRQVMAPVQSGEEGAVGARGVFERFLGGGDLTLVGADAFGRMVAPRWHLEIAGELRTAPATAAPHGRVSALGLGGSATFFVRVVGARRASLAVGAGAAASWLSFRAEPAPGADGAPYANLLVVGRLRVVGRIALGRALHVTAGVDVGAALRGVEATDAGAVVASARGLLLGANLGIESP
ncbi:MAG TPA: hypothetical protein VN903_07550 [Polyangia bacterium]|nr:hypothetical protein [Polyangia bacterium]